MYHDNEWHRVFIITDGKEHGIRILSEKSGSFVKTFSSDDMEENVSNADLTSMWTKAINESQWKPEEN